MEFIKQGKSADEIRYEEAKKAATDEAQRQRIQAYKNRQILENVKASGIILPDNIQ